MTNNLDEFVNVIRKDPKVRIEINDTLNRFMRLPHNYRSKIRNRSCLISSNIVEKYAFV